MENKNQQPNIIPDQIILKCPKCTQALKLIKEPNGFRKDGKPTKKEIDFLVCTNCGHKMH